MYKKSVVSNAIHFFSVCLLFILALAGWRVAFFEIKEKETLLYSAPLARAQCLTTSYIHSVEKTEVQDEYRFACGKLWAWEERVRSSNAGMPSILPKYTRFINSGDALLFRGGRITFDSLNLRVGNERFGKNRARLAPFSELELYKTLQGKLLSIKVISKPYLFQKSRGLGCFSDWLR